MFAGKGTGEDGVVQFVIPQMKNKLQEGTYAARVEVLIENRYFSPVQFQLNFKKTMQVFAEAVNVVQRSAKPDIKVSASPIVVASSKPEPKPIVVQHQEPAPKQPVKTQQVAEVAEPVRKSSGSTLREKFARMSGKSDSDRELRELAKKLIKMTEG